MKALNTFAVAAALAASPFIASSADACPKDKAKTAELAKVSVKEANTLKKQGKIIMVDANSDDTRANVGYVPGARLLTSYNKFKDSELKASKDDTLVFYCYNTSCSAAPRAAEVAMKRGYKAKVMDAGVMGWKKAGYKLSKLSRPAS